MPFPSNSPGGVVPKQLSFGFVERYLSKTSGLDESPGDELEPRAPGRGISDAAPAQPAGAAREAVKQHEAGNAGTFPVTQLRGELHAFAELVLGIAPVGVRRLDRWRTLPRSTRACRPSSHGGLTRFRIPVACIPMAAPRPVSSPRALVLEVTLCHVRPPVWRRFTMRDDARFDELHDVLQAVMGWEDSHLHQFETGERRIGLPDLDLPEPLEDERRVRLRDVLRRPGDRVRYEYDFGDGWEHDVELIEVRPHEPRSRYPVILDGRRACPPEDCGGPGGYANLLAALRSPKHADHRELREWIGDRFDAQRFDAGELNRRFHGGWFLPEQTELALPAARGRVGSTAAARPPRGRTKAVAVAPRVATGPRSDSDLGPSRAHGTALQPGERMGWITDARHSVGANGRPAGAPAARGIARHIGAIIAVVTASTEPLPRLLAVRCRRRPGHVPCVGLVAANMSSPESSIRWECVACGDHGEISHWQGTPWDKHKRPRSRSL